jgi:ribosomal protein S25
MSAGSAKASLRLVNMLAANPFLTVKGAAKELKVAFTTAQRAIDRLEAHGIVQQTSDARRNRVYCAQALMDILEEPVRLTPMG